jgi:hypothetical protein
MMLKSSIIFNQCSSLFPYYFDEHQNRLITSRLTNKTYHSTITNTILIVADFLCLYKSVILHDTTFLTHVNEPLLNGHM